MKRGITTLLAMILLAMMVAVPMSARAAGAGATAGQVVTASGPLIVRGSASTASQALTTLAKGSYVTLISKSGSWWKVEYAPGRTGYCHSAYIQQTAGSWAAFVDLSWGRLTSARVPVPPMGSKPLWRREPGWWSSPNPEAGAGSSTRVPGSGM